MKHRKNCGGKWCMGRVGKLFKFLAFFKAEYSYMPSLFCFKCSNFGNRKDNCKNRDNHSETIKFTLLKCMIEYVFLECIHKLCNHNHYLIQERLLHPKKEILYSLAVIPHFFLRRHLLSTLQYTKTYPKAMKKILRRIFIHDPLLFNTDNNNSSQHQYNGYYV